jgi:hypothetical protein
MATYYVSSTFGNNSNPGTISQPKLTINAGIGLLSAGDRLIIRGGTYNERLVESEHGGSIVYPRASSWATATIIEAAAGETVIVAPTANEGNPVIGTNLGPDNYYLWFLGHDQNFIVDGSHVTNSQSVTKPQTPFTRFDSLEIYTDHSLGGASNCVLITNDYIEILNCNIHDAGPVPLPPTGNFGAYAIYASGNNLVIRNNELHHCTGFGIQIYKSGGSPHNDDFSGNVVHHNATFGGGFVYGGLIVMGTNHRIYNNIFHSNIGDGLSAYYYGDETGTIFYNNTIYGNSGRGLVLNRDVTARNNISYGNSGVQIGTDSGGGSYTEDHNLTTDPLFVNAGAADFHLQAGSDAIDAGVDVSVYGIGTDIEGSARVQGSGTDIGAYEYAGAVIVTTIYVAKTGSDSNPGTFPSPKLTINGGIAALSSGYTLYIRGGTYEEFINGGDIPSGGGEGSRTYIKSYPGETVTIKPNASGATVLNFVSGAGKSYITIDGDTGANARGFACRIIIDATNQGEGWGVRFGAGNDHITFNGIEVRNAIGSGDNPANGFGVSGTFGIFKNCAVHDNGLIPGSSGSGGYGFYINSGTDDTIEYNRVYNNGGWGINLTAVNDVEHYVERVIIRFNEVFGNGQVAG